MLERVDRVVRNVENVLCTLLVVAMVGVIALQIVFRYFLSRPLSWSGELAVFMLIALTFLGMAVAQRDGAHVAMRALPAIETSAFGRYGSLAAMVALFGLIGWGGSRLILLNGAQHSPALDLPFWAVLAVLPLSALLGLYHVLVRLGGASPSTGLRTGSASEVEAPPEASSTERC